MWTRALLKDNAKYAMRGRFGKCLLASLAVDAIPFLYSLILTIAMFVIFLPLYFGVLQNPSYYETQRGAWELLAQINAIYSRFSTAQLIDLALSVFVVLPLTVSSARFFVHNRFGHVDLNLVKTGFTANYGNTLGAMFTTRLFIALWGLLFTIPGIYKSYQYCMVPYLLSDNPSLSGSRAREISRMMTDGEKGRIFVLDLSFLGWFLLGSLTFGIGTLFVNAYYRATMAELYVCLRGNALQRGYVTPAELNLAPPAPHLR